MESALFVIDDPAAGECRARIKASAARQVRFFYTLFRFTFYV
jgi:hypothetical protein